MTLHHRWVPAAALRAAKPPLGHSATLQCPSQLARTLDWHAHHHCGAKRGGGGGSVVRPCRQPHAPLPPPHHHLSRPTNTMRKTTPVIVSLSIGRTHLDVTLATHPSLLEPVQVLPSIALLHPTRHENEDDESCNEKENDTNRVQRQRLLSPFTVQTQLFDSLARCLVDTDDDATAAGPNGSRSRSSSNSTALPVALLVAWPIQRDNGRCGAACGRVLHYLDHFLYGSGTGRASLSNRDNDHGNSSAVTDKDRTSSLAPLLHGLDSIPLCLYNVHQQFLLQPDEDEWGRCAAHARAPPSTVTEHVASRDQYWTKQCDNSFQQSLATSQWLEFGRVHWPQWPILVEPLHQQRHRTVSAITTTATTAPSVDTRAAAIRLPNDKSLPRQWPRITSQDSMGTMARTAQPPFGAPRRPTLLSERPPRGGQIVWAATA
jgi:hypothetical protein